MFVFFSVSQRMVKVGLRVSTMTVTAVHALGIIGPDDQTFLGIIFLFKKSLQRHSETLGDA
jgi:hypothetical protein